MRKYFVLLVFFISGCSSSQSIHLRYEGESYYLPTGIEEVGALGDRDRFLVFKYSREKGKKYLAFSSSETIDKGDCDYSEFFSSVIQKDDTRSPCDKDKLEAFRDAFISGSGAGHWKINSLDHYYFITEHAGTFVFKVRSSDAIVKVDSDFLGPEELYSIFESGDS